MSTKKVTKTQPPPPTHTTEIRVTHRSGKQRTTTTLAFAGMVRLCFEPVGGIR